MINILIEDGFAVTRKGGIGRFTNDIIKYLSREKDFTIFFYRKKILTKIKPLFLRRIFYFCWLNTVFLFKLKKNKINIIYFTNYMVPIIKAKNLKFIVAIHDISPLIYPKTKSFIYKIYFSIIIRIAIIKADYLTTISYSSYNDIIKYFKVEKKIKVLYIGIDNENFKISTNLDKTFNFLYVGSIEERKNIIYMIKILEKVIYGNKEMKLIICGQLGYNHKKIINYINNSKIRHQIILYLNIDDEALKKLYSKNLYFFYPSSYEGFGLPLIEALYYGLIIIAIDNTINREILSTSAIFIPNDNIEKSVKIINSLLENRKIKTYITRNKELIYKKFLWKNLINEYIKFFKDII